MEIIDKELPDEVLLSDIKSSRNTLQTDRLDMSFGEIMSMYEKEEIIINPEFQRLYRWNDYQKTRFIESIIIGIPIPPIFVAEDEDGRWELVDGLQRLSTIFSFFGILNTLPEKNDWEMMEGDLIKSLEGYTCSDLPMKIRLNIKRVACRIEIVKWNSEYDLRFELFNRLNTGGSPLTNQEIRNSIYRGISSDFNDFLKKLSENKQFIELIKPTDKQKSELYLEELVLRFISLYNNRNNVKKSIAQHMTEFMKASVENKVFDYEKHEDIFNRTIQLLNPLKSGIFKKHHRASFSTALYDTVMIGISENINLYEKHTNEKHIAENIIRKKIDIIKSDEYYRNMTRSGGNNSIERVKKRLKYATEIFSQI